MLLSLPVTPKAAHLTGPSLPLTTPQVESCCCGAEQASQHILNPERVPSHAPSFTPQLAGYLGPDPAGAVRQGPHSRVLDPTARQAISVPVIHVAPDRTCLAWEPQWRRTSGYAATQNMTAAASAACCVPREETAMQQGKNWKAALGDPMQESELATHHTHCRSSTGTRAQACRQALQPHMP